MTSDWGSRDRPGPLNLRKWPKRERLFLARARHKDQKLDKVMHRPHGHFLELLIGFSSDRKHDVMQRREEEHDQPEHHPGDEAKSDRVEEPHPRKRQTPRGRRAILRGIAITARGIAHGKAPAWVSDRLRCHVDRARPASSRVRFYSPTEWADQDQAGEEAAEMGNPGDQGQIVADAYPQNAA